MHVMVGVKTPGRPTSYVWETNLKKVIAYSVVTVDDDACAQRQETVGT